MQSMSWWERIIIAKTRFLSRVISRLGLGAGATWPGEIALSFSPSILSSLTTSLGEGLVLVVGTNGKTTTALMLAQILTNQGKRVVHNASGANLVNGIVSSFIVQSDWLGRVNADWGVFEVDENSLPIVLRYVKPRAIVILNLFRDQLDRYGEVDVIVEKWGKAIKKITGETTLVINSDDPGVAHLGKAHRVVYFGVNDKTKFLKTSEHATDSAFCTKCGARLHYDGVYYSHIGIWACPECGAKRPNPTVYSFPSALPGLYNQYNTLAAVATAQALGLRPRAIKASLRSFAPAFGRQEELVVNGKRIKLFLSKNPAGFNASLRTVLEMGAKDILFVLNDRIPDGRDVSWIWDVDFEMLPADITPVVSGDRVYDLALRLKYAGLETVVEPHLHKAIAGKQEYILATYSAMLEVRKILTGKKIL